MKGLCFGCYGSNRSTTLHADSGLPFCTACIKKKAEEQKPIEHCNCKVCPVHNDLTVEPEPVGVPEG